MNKTLILLIVSISGFISCNTSEPGNSVLNIATMYYEALDHSDYLRLKDVISDSITTKEVGYVRTFSPREYHQLLQWDSIFEPTYKVLKMDKVGDVVKATISKKDKRILFLHENPIVTREILRFSKGRIVSVEITAYERFNDEIFVAKRDSLLRWIDENHPELNGFIYDQTASGAKNYLKAMELYANRNEVINQTTPD